MRQPDDVCEITITAPDAQWLINLGQQLVEDGLCAAAHTIQGIRTIYRWQGQIYDAVEAKTTLHTRLSLTDQIIERVTREHPYEVPDVIVTPILAGNRDYLRWIEEQSNHSQLGDNKRTDDDAQ